MTAILNFLTTLGKLVLVGAIILFAGVEIIGCTYVNLFQNRSQVITPPTAAKAPYQLVQESTLRTVAYAQKATESGSAVTVTNWYSLSGSRFVFHKGSFTIDEKYWGKITIRKRTQ